MFSFWLFQLRNKFHHLRQWHSGAVSICQSKFVQIVFHSAALMQQWCFCKFFKWKSWSQLDNLWRIRESMMGWFANDVVGCSRTIWAFQAIEDHQTGERHTNWKRHVEKKLHTNIFDNSKDCVSLENVSTNFWHLSFHCEFGLLRTLSTSVANSLDIVKLLDCMSKQSAITKLCFCMLCRHVHFPSALGLIIGWKLQPPFYVWSAPLFFLSKNLGSLSVVVEIAHHCALWQTYNKVVHNLAQSEQHSLKLSDMPCSCFSSQLLGPFDFCEWSTRGLHHSSLGCAKQIGSCINGEWQKAQSRKMTTMHMQIMKKTWFNVIPTKHQSQTMQQKLLTLELANVDNSLLLYVFAVMQKTSVANFPANLSHPKASGILLELLWWYSMLMIWCICVLICVKHGHTTAKDRQIQEAHLFSAGSLLQWSNVQEELSPHHSLLVVPICQHLTTQKEWQAIKVLDQLKTIENADVALPILLLHFWLFPWIPGKRINQDITKWEMVAVPFSPTGNVAQNQRRPHPSCCYSRANVELQCK